MSKQDEKKKPTRKDNPYAALDPKLTLKTRYEEIADLDSYAHTLPKEAKDWLNSYAEEEIHVNLHHKGQKLNDLEDPANRTRLWLKNNARNRCVLSRESAAGSLSYLEEMGEHEDEDDNSEDFTEDLNLFDNRESTE